jgi:hypothetical protein
MDDDCEDAGRHEPYLQGWRLARLAANTLDTLEAIRIAMTGYGDHWQNEILGKNSLQLLPDELRQCEIDLRGFRDEEPVFPQEWQRSQKMSGSSKRFKG